MTKQYFFYERGNGKQKHNAKRLKLHWEENIKHKIIFAIDDKWGENYNGKEKLQEII